MLYSYHVIACYFLTLLLPQSKCLKSALRPRLPFNVECHSLDSSSCSPHFVAALVPGKTDKSVQNDRYKVKLFITSNVSLNKSAPFISCDCILFPDVISFIV